MRATALALLLLAAACTPERAYPQIDAAVSSDGATAEVTLKSDAAEAADGADVQPKADTADVPPDVAADVADASTADVGAAGDADATADVESAAPDVADALADTDSDDAMAGMPDATVGAADTTGGDMASVDVPGGATNVDLIGVNWSCSDTAWQPAACGAGIVTDPPLLPGLHVDLPTPITYTDSPPASGSHRPNWAKWGEFSYLPKQRWLHNLEHGGVAFLYNPCAPKATVDAWRALAKAQLPDAGGPFRWVLTPYPDLPAAIALVAWGHVYVAQCVQPTEVDAFLKAHYNKAPEDSGSPGGYDTLWLSN